VEQLKVVKTPKEVQVKRQVPFVLPQPKKERQMRTTQSVVSVPDTTDTRKDLIEDHMRRETKQIVKDQHLTTKIKTEIVKEDTKNIELQRTVYLRKEVPGKEIEVPVDLPVEVDIERPDVDGSDHAKKVIEQLDAELRQARARELRFAAELQALTAAAEEARQRRSALRGALGASRPAPTPLVREVVKEVPVEREELTFEVEEAAVVPSVQPSGKEREALLKSMRAELEGKEGETAVIMMKRDEAQAQRLLAKRRLERVLERERALKRLERDLKDVRSDHLLEVRNPPASDPHAHIAVACLSLERCARE
jgi:hypothetical protein